DGNLVWNGPLLDQTADVRVGEVVQRRDQLIELQLRPGARLGLLPRVRPRIGVVEVDAELHSPLLHPAGHLECTLRALTGRRAWLACALVARLVEDPQTNELHPAVSSHVEEVRARSHVLQGGV